MSRSGDELAIESLIADVRDGTASYDEVKQRYAELTDHIRRRYEREITALSLDVVQSREMKVGAGPLDSQLTFDAFHRLMDHTLQSGGCRTHVWSGDGVMAVFRQPDDAVAVAQSILAALPDFNEFYNRLNQPFRVRIGIHCGTILPGDDPGRISSPTFDTAGHLQKSAQPDQILISDSVQARLTTSQPLFAPVSGVRVGGCACFAHPCALGVDDLTLPPVEHAEITRQLSVAAPPVVESARSGPAWELRFIAVAAVIAVLLLVSVGVFWVARQLAPSGDTGPIGGLSRVGGSVFGGVSPTPAPQRPGPAAEPQPTRPADAPPAGAPPTPPTRPRWEPTPARGLWESPAVRAGVPVALRPSAPELTWILSVRSPSSVQEESVGRQDADEVAGALRLATRAPAAQAVAVAEALADRAGVKQQFVRLQQSVIRGQETVYLVLSGADEVTPNGWAFLCDGWKDDAESARITLGELMSWIGALRAQTVILVLDTPRASLVSPPITTDTGRQLLVVARNSISSQPGLLSRAISRALLGPADLNRDGIITTQELLGYLKSAGDTGGQPQVRTGFGGYLPNLILYSPRPR